MKGLNHITIPFHKIMIKVTFLDIFIEAIFLSGITYPSC